MQGQDCERATEGRWTLTTAAMRRRSFGLRYTVALVVLVPLTAGCPGIGLPGGPVEDGNRDTTLTSPLGKTSGEPNDTFDQAVVAVFDDQGMARLQGAVSTVGDLDVFRLTAMAPGDRVVVDTRTTGSSLDVTVAVFDDQERLVANNDDRGGSTSRFLDAYVDFVVRHAGDPYYLVVTHSPFALRGTMIGTYEVDVRITPGATVPPPRPQVFWLNFAGGEVDSPVLGRTMLRPFDAGDISPIYAGQTDAMKAAIVAEMEQNFERFDVILLSSDDGPPPTNVPVSIVYFGGFRSGVFGIAEAVDLYNAERCDDAIVFTESFRPGIFSRTPSVAQIGAAIGNVAAHECGHLLGLNHVSDDLAIMDDQSPADALIKDQEFIEAPLSRDVMEIGTQDSVMLLDQIVGPR